MKGNSLDSGPILKQEFISINPDDLVGDLMKKVENKGVDLVLESVQGFVDGKIETLPQDENEALYCYPRLPRDGEIDWNQSSKKIIKLIRAANHPYPGAYSYFRDHLNDKKIIKLVIRRACVFEDNISSFCAVPGHVIKIKNKICVVCGDDKIICLQDIEFDEKPVSPEKAFNSVRQRLGLNLSDEIIKLRSEINDLRRSLNKLT
jgi:methionyl-tRNA formyltransferase